MKAKTLLVTSAVVLVVIFAFVLYLSLTQIQHAPNASSTSSQLPSVESNNSSLVTRSMGSNNSASSHSSSANPYNTPYSTCLLEVPNDAIIDYLSVTYSNGTRLTFAIDSCLRPAHPVQYRIGLAVGSSQKFVNAENGSLYALRPFTTIEPGYTQYSYTSGTVTCSTNVQEEWGGRIINSVRGCFPFIVLVFTLYSNQTIPVCNSGSTEKELGEIQVEISLNATGGIDLSRMSIFKLTEPDLNVVHCTTILTATIPGGTTSYLPVRLSRSWGSWLFTFSIGETDVNSSRPVSVWGNLTYLGQTNITVSMAKPFLKFVIYDSSGVQHWSYEPPSYTNETVTKGETFAQDGCLATSFPASDEKCFFFPFVIPRGTYTLKVQPLIFSYSSNRLLGDNLEITTNFTVL